MARFYEPSPEQLSGWNEWVASRPENVRKVAERFDPWSLYRMKETGHRVSIASFGEGGDGIITLTVNVSAEYNIVLFESSVFGVNPDDLEPCDLPGHEEVVGAVMTSEQVEENIDELRAAVRPDLWEIGTDGQSHRKDN